MAYTRRPELYDLEYSFKDYAKEAATLERIIGERNPDAKTLLDVACGTGKHLEHLRRTFECEGADLDEGLLGVARDRVPDVPLHHADMRDFDLGRRFDVITCLFSAIGFVGGTDGLTATARAFARHLNAGGIVLVEPWITPDAWMTNRPHLLTYEEPAFALARVTVSGLRDERISTTEMHYLVATPAGVEHFVETHEPYLFTTDEMRAAFEAAGLAVDYDAEGLIGRGLWICSR
ncbi:MAG: class I SAM-dependent methyltransferase [Gaiellaceae bacterium]